MNPELEAIKIELGEGAGDLPQFTHFSWCIKEFGKSYKISIDMLDDLYVGLVSGIPGAPELGEIGLGPIPEERFSSENYLKLFYSIVEYGRILFPFDEWIKTHPEGQEWVDIIEEASAVNEEFEKDPERWLINLRETLSNQES